MEGYNLRYVLKYCNVDGIPLRINIKWKGYTGNTFVLVDVDRKYLLNADGDFVVIEKEGEYDPETDASNVEGTRDPFILKYYTDTSDKSASIRATGAEMSFFENNVFNIDDMLTSEETDILVEFLYDDQIEWIGFVMPDFFYNEITSNPVINLTATDRLGILKDVSYPLDPYMDSNARVNYLTIIRTCLDQTGLTLPINVLCGHVAKEWDTGSTFQHAFVRTFVSEMRFQESDNKVLDCYSVLQSICRQFNCFLTQYQGEWWIVNKEQRAKGLGNVIKFDVSGNAVSNIPFEKDAIRFSSIYTGGQRSIIPTGALNTVLLNHGEEQLYPENRTFMSTDNTNVRLWSKNPSPLVSYIISPNVTTDYNSNGSIRDTYLDSRSWLRNTECIYDFVSHQGLPSLARIDDQGYYVLESERFLVPTIDGKRTSFDLTVRAVGKPNSSIMLMIGIEFDDPFFKYAGLRYFEADASNPAGYLFSFSKFLGDTGPFTNITNGLTNNVIVFGFENKYNNLEIAVEQEFKISVHAAGGVNQNNLDLSKAKMFVRVYPNKTQGNVNSVYYTSNIIKEIKIDFNSDSQEPTGTVFQTRVEDVYTRSTERKEVMFGDFLTSGRNGFFYRYRDDSLSIQYTEDGRMTKNWTTPSDQRELPLLEHAVDEFTRSVGRAHNELRISFDTNRVSPLSDIEVNCPSNSNAFKYVRNKKYTLLEGQVDYLRGVFTGTILEDTYNNVNSKGYIYSYFDQNDIM